MFKNLGIKAKMVLTTGVVVSIISVLVTIIVYNQAKDSAIENHFTRVDIVKEEKRKIIEQYFSFVQNQLIHFSQEQMLINAMEGFKKTFHEVNITTDYLNYKNIKQPVESYYETILVPKLRDSANFIINSNQLIPKDPKSVKFQNKYLLNVNRISGDITTTEATNHIKNYNNLHIKYHPLLKSYLEKFEYSDIYLIDNLSGHIVYSVKKKNDYATSLFKGPLRESKLSKIFGHARNINSKNGFYLEDYDFYLPSLMKPTTFIAKPVFNGGIKVGVLVFQLSTNKISNLITGNNEWLTEGLQKMGKVYIVGKDQKRKTASRLLHENPDEFCNSMKINGMPLEKINKIKLTKSAIQLQKFENEAIEEAFEGISDHKTISNKSGTKFLSSYSPLNINGLNWVIVSEFSRNEALANVNKVIIIITIVVLIILALAIRVAFPIGNSLSEPIIKLTQDIEKISKGNLTVDVSAETKDEVGQTTLALKSMMGKLKEVISNIASSAENISLASKEMNASSQQMSEGATEQASAAEQISASMEQMAANIQQNSDNASETEKISKISAKEIITGNEAANQTAESMKTIADKISIVDEMSRLTNLLAVNAAVEAVKKGKFGIGFSVVAAEIRRLAESSQTSAIEIGAITNECVEIAQSSGNLLKEIVPKVQKTAELVREISAGSKEQSSVTELINNSIQHLNAVVQHNAATAEELAANSTELSSLADKLKELVKFFNIGSFAVSDIEIIKNNDKNNQKNTDFEDSNKTNTIDLSDLENDNNTDAED